jgi:hypothetical protein
MTNDERRYLSAATQIGTTLAEYMEKRSQGLKWCSGIKHWEPVAGFGRNNSTSDGLALLCRNCMNSDSKRIRARNRERNLARQSGVPVTAI